MGLGGMESLVRCSHDNQGITRPSPGVNTFVLLAD